MKLCKTPTSETRTCGDQCEVFPQRFTRSIWLTIYTGCKIRELFSHVTIPVSLVVMGTFLQNKTYTTFQLIHSVFWDETRFNVRYKFVITECRLPTQLHIEKHSDMLLYSTSKMVYDVFLCYTETEICTCIMWISFSLQNACSRTHCIWRAALPWLPCGMMQKSTLSGSASSNLIAGVSPHVRRFSVWAFLKTVTTALHNDFLFTTQENRPLLTCIAINPLNRFTQTYVAVLHHTCITIQHITHEPLQRICCPTTGLLTWYTDVLSTGITLRHITPHRRRKDGEYERPYGMKVGDLPLQSRLLYRYHTTCRFSITGHYHSALETW